MKNRIDETLINQLTKDAKKEKTIKSIKSRLRVKGILIEKSFSRKGNLNLKIRKGKDEYTFTILKSHKEKMERASRLLLRKSVSMEGINRFKAIICTRFKALDKGIDESRQTRMQAFIEG